MTRSMLTFILFALFASSAVAQEPIRATHPNGEVALVVDFEVKPGFETEFETAFGRSTRCSRLEPGNVSFNIHRVIDTPGRYVLYEIWRSPEALESHFQQSYTVALFSMFDHALVRPISEGGLRFIGDLDPASRPAPSDTDPAGAAECR